MNYYVYYKLEPQRLPLARSLVNELFEKIEKQCGVRGRWMRRRDDPTTYMEVYEGVQDEDAFEAVMTSEGAKVAPNRRLERFVSA
ncbi:MAG TPA: DUF4936 family protein [Burkholderiales bacterium]|nr:DUF4936 family protein [Burkholderiales bacterium]